MHKRKRHYGAKVESSLSSMTARHSSDSWLSIFVPFRLILTFLSASHKRRKRSNNDGATEECVVGRTTHYPLLTLFSCDLLSQSRLAHFMRKCSCCCHLMCFLYGVKCGANSNLDIRVVFKAKELLATRRWINRASRPTD